MPPAPPLQIAFCITELDPGGAERALVELATRLDRSRFSPRVISLGPRGPLVEVLEQNQIPTQSLGARSRYDLGVIRRLRHALLERPPDLLQTWLFHANLAGRIAGRLAGVPVIVSGIRVAERRARWPLLLDRWTSGWVRAHVCVSQAVAEFTHREARLPWDRLVVIPNGVDPERFETAEPIGLAEFAIPEDAPVFVTVGRLDPQKGLPDLLEAIPRVAQQFSAVHWLLVGDGPLRESLTRQIRSLNLTDRVHLTGWRGDVPRILKRAIGLILPSLWEGMPNVVLEAMAAGLPVVATSVEGVTELVIPDQTGWLVPPSNPASLTAGMISLLEDLGRAREFGLRGRARVLQDFSWDQMVVRYAALYESLAGPRRLASD